MADRSRLPNRRPCQTIAYEHNGRHFVASIGIGPNGLPMELFLNSSGKRGSEADTDASDAAVAISLALQYGCPLEIIRDALKHNADGSPSGPLGRALDIAVTLLGGGEQAA